jgi:peptide/nickel transport system permease protein
MPRPAVVACAAVVIVGVLALILLPPLLGLDERAVVGTPFQPPGSGFLLGTDAQGRDVAGRTLLGMRTSLAAALVVVTAGAVVGTLVGLLAGLAGGVLDTILMRVTDAALALPGTLVALAVAAALGAGLTNTVIALSVTWWPWYARIVRGEVVNLRHRPFVEAARLARLGPTSVAFRHLLPGLGGALVVVASLDIGAVMVVLAGLSFLGLGSPPPAAELGAMTNQGLTYWFNAPWVALVPALGLFALAVVANVAGDVIRDRWEADA